MMDTEILTRSLDLKTFSLDFKVVPDASIESTTSFQPHGVEGYVFAVGEIWLRAAGEAARLLVEEVNTGNVIETLRALERRVTTMQSDPELESVIRVGGWSQWMAGYWERLNADSNSATDDVVYDVLITSLVVDGKAGCIAAYQHGNAAVIEACTRPGVGDPPVSLSAQIESRAFCDSVKNISAELCEAIRARM